MKIGWIVASLGAAVIASPLVTKPLALNQVNNVVFEIDKDLNGSGLILERQTEEFGFLSSEFVTRASSLDSEENICIDLRTEVSHSFIDVLSGRVASTKTTILPMAEQAADCGIKQLFEQDAQLAAFYEENYSDKSPIVVEASHGLSGAVNGYFELLPFKLNVERNDEGIGPISIQSAALSGRVNASSKLDRYTFNSKWDGFEALIDDKSGAVKFRIKEMYAEGEHYLAYDSVWLGDLNQTFSEISMSRMGENGVSKYTLPSLDFESNAYEDSNGIQSRAKIITNNINGDLGDFILDISLSNLDGETLAAFTKVLDEIVESNEFQQVKNLEGQQAALIDYGKQMLAKASLDINAIRYTLNEEEILFTGSLKAPGIAQLNLDQVIANPMMALGIINLEINGKVDKGFSAAISGPGGMAMAKAENPAPSDAEIKQASQALQMIVDGQLAAGVGMGFLIDNGATYNSQLKYENGMPMINGQPMQLPTIPDQQ